MIPLVAATLAQLVAGCVRPGLPSLPETRANVDASCDSASCVAVPRVVDPAAPATLWSVRFSGGTMKLPADPAAEWIALVLRGRLEAVGCPPVGPWQAVRVDGSSLSLKGHADAVLALVRDGAVARPLAQSPEHVGRCEHVDLEKLPDHAWARGRAHARMVFRSKKAYFGLLFSDAGVGAPPHVHEREWEVVHVLRGAGEVTAGDEIGPLMGGLSYAFPPGQRHGFKSEGGTPTVAVQLYSPPGPEQRFLEPSK